jgi:Fe-S-cluster-containing hydrogenase component 2
MATVVRSEKCTGCRSCELACSFHHRKVFSPSLASIHIVRDEEEGEFGIEIYRESETGHLACNCPPADKFCMRYCPAVARDQLNAILGTW